MLGSKCAKATRSLKLVSDRGHLRCNFWLTFFLDASLAFLFGKHMQEKPGSVGFLMPNVEARLVDDDEKDVPRGFPGELWVRGPNIMKYASPFPSLIDF